MLSRYYLCVSIVESNIDPRTPIEVKSKDKKNIIGQYERDEIIHLEQTYKFFLNSW